VAVSEAADYIPSCTDRLNILATAQKE